GLRLEAMKYMIPNPEKIVERLSSFQRTVREMIIATRRTAGMHEVSRSSSADTIYKIDAEVDPLLEEFCRDWSRELPLVLVAEGLEDEDGQEADFRVFPHGISEQDAPIRLLVDPIDGTRPIMYDKRSAWALAGVAPNKGAHARLRDIEVAVMTELPTSKMGQADVLWAIRGRGPSAYRADLRDGSRAELKIAPSQAAGIDHGFASITNFFPGTKILAGELMEYLAAHLIGPADVTRATVYEDQYISTGGQFYELLVGHDRFNADLRPWFYKIQDQPPGLCCHPYDCATWLIAEEAGIVITDGLGRPMDGPLDVTTPIAWAAFANRALQQRIEPILTNFLRDKLGDKINI
ncbi:MAG: inositol monophosphatase, partial [Tepidisphaeraceae bacterium]